MASLNGWLWSAQAAGSSKGKLIEQYTPDSDFPKEMVIKKASIGLDHVLRARFGPVFMDPRPRHRPETQNR